MQISGNFLPVPYSQSGNSLARDTPSDESRAALELSRDDEQRGQQQTVEYVFRGEFFEDVVNDQRNHANSNRANINQEIDPANRAAISSYLEAGAGSVAQPERQGRYLDIFI